MEPRSIGQIGDPIAPLSDELQALVWNKEGLAIQAGFVVETRVLTALHSVLPNPAEVSREQYEQFERLIRHVRSAIDTLKEGVISAFKEKGEKTEGKIMSHVKENLLAAQASIRDYAIALLVKKNGNTLEAVRVVANAMTETFEPKNLTEDALLAVMMNYNDKKLDVEDFVRTKEQQEPQIRITFNNLPTENIAAKIIQEAQNAVKEIPEFRWSWTDDELFAEKKLPQVVRCIHTYQELEKMWEEAGQELLRGMKEWKEQCKDYEMLAIRSGRLIDIDEVLSHRETTFALGLPERGKSIKEFFEKPYWEIDSEYLEKDLRDNLASFCTIQNGPAPLFIGDALRKFFEMAKTTVQVAYPFFISEGNVNKEMKCYVPLKRVDVYVSPKDIFIERMTRINDFDSSEKLETNVINLMWKKHSDKIKSNLKSLIGEAARLLQRNIEKDLTATLPDQITSRSHLEYVQNCKTALAQALATISAFSYSDLPTFLLMELKNAASFFVTRCVRVTALSSSLGREWTMKHDAQMLENELVNFYPLESPQGDEESLLCTKIKEDRCIPRWWEQVIAAAQERLRIDIAGREDEDAIQNRISSKIFEGSKIQKLTDIDFTSPTDLKTFETGLHAAVQCIPSEVGVGSKKHPIPPGIKEFFIGHISMMINELKTAFGVEFEEEIPEFRRHWSGEEILSYFKLPTVYRGYINVEQATSHFDQYANNVMRFFDAFEKQSLASNKHSDPSGLAFLTKALNQSRNELVDGLEKEREFLFPKNCCLYIECAALEQMLEGGRAVTNVFLDMIDVSLVKQYRLEFEEIFRQREPIDCGLQTDQLSKQWSYFLFKRNGPEKLWAIENHVLPEDCDAPNILAEYLTRHGIDANEPKIKFPLHQAQKKAESLFISIWNKKYGFSLESNIIDPIDEIENLELECEPHIAAHLRNALSLWILSLHSFYRYCFMLAVGESPPDLVHPLHELSVNMQRDSTTADAKNQKSEFQSEWTDAELFPTDSLPIVQRKLSDEELYQEWQIFCEEIMRVHEDECKQMKSVPMGFDMRFGVLPSATRDQIAGMVMDSDKIKYEIVMGPQKAKKALFEFLFQYGLPARMESLWWQSEIEQIRDDMAAQKHFDHGEEEEEFVAKVRTFGGLVAEGPMFHNGPVQGPLIVGKNLFLVVRKQSSVRDHMKIFCAMDLLKEIDEPICEKLFSYETIAHERKKWEGAARREIHQFTNTLSSAIGSFAWAREHMNPMSLLEEIRSFYQIIVQVCETYEIQELVQYGCEFRSACTFALARECKERALMLLAHFDGVSENKELVDAFKNFCKPTDQELELKKEDVQFPTVSEINILWKNCERHLQYIEGLDGEEKIALQHLCDYIESLVPSDNKIHAEWFARLSRLRLELVWKDQTPQGMQNDQWKKICKLLEKKNVDSAIIHSFEAFLDETHITCDIPNILSKEIVDRVEAYALAYKLPKHLTDAAQLFSAMHSLIVDLPSRMDASQIQAILEKMKNEIVNYRTIVFKKFLKLQGVQKDEIVTTHNRVLEREQETFGWLEKSCEALLPEGKVQIKLAAEKQEREAPSMAKMEKKSTLINKEELLAKHTDIIDLSTICIDENNPATVEGLLSAINRIQKVGQRQAGKDGRAQKELVEFRRLARNVIQEVAGTETVISNEETYRDIIRCLCAAASRTVTAPLVHEAVRIAIAEERKSWEPASEHIVLNEQTVPSSPSSIEGALNTLGIENNEIARREFVARTLQSIAVEAMERQLRLHPELTGSEAAWGAIEGKAVSMLRNIDDVLRIVPLHSTNLSELHSVLNRVIPSILDEGAPKDVLSYVRDEVLGSIAESGDAATMLLTHMPSETFTPENALQVARAKIVQSQEEEQLIENRERTVVLRAAVAKKQQLLRNVIQEHLSRLERTSNPAEQKELLEQLEDLNRVLDGVASLFSPPHAD